MQLNVTTDYAVRILILLHQKGGSATSKEISEETGIPYRYLVKVMSKLRGGGLVNSLPGPTGCYTLLVPISQIEMGRIYAITEQSMQIARCMDEEGVCSQSAKGKCPVQRYYEAMQKHLEQEWFCVTLQEILDNY